MDLPWDSIIKPIKEYIANKKKEKENEKEKEKEIEKEEPAKDPFHIDPNKKVKHSDIMATEQLMMRRFKQAIIQTKQSRVRQFQKSALTDSVSPNPQGSQVRLVASATNSPNEYNTHYSQTDLSTSNTKEKSFKKEQNLPDIAN